DTETFEMIVIPGGAEGVQNLIADPFVERLLLAHLERQGYIAALCAAPALLAELHLLHEDTAITSHPSVQHILQEFTYLEESVVIDNNIITSRAAGTAFEFALALVEILTNPEKSEKIARDILFNLPADE
ncbi:MAG TPA: DJ-1/PfpI family protein, partial [Candidatus Kapabacteria bacterium]|nr:DJ-1/PfpI family protein [Candidatus Kapabacteria bacterium]